MWTDEELAKAQQSSAKAAAELAQMTGTQSHVERAERRKSELYRLARLGLVASRISERERDTLWREVEDIASLALRDFLWHPAWRRE